MSDLTWRRVFAWWPVHTECGKVWLTHVMQGTYLSDRSDKIHLTCAAYVNYRLEDKLSG